MTGQKKAGPEAIVREIKRNTRRKFSAEEKIHIVLEGLRVKESITAISRREGINPNLYYRWSKSFLEPCRNRKGIIYTLSSSTTLVELTSRGYRW